MTRPVPRKTPPVKTTSPSAEPQTLSVGKIRVDPVCYDVWVDGEPVQLTLMQFNILRAMARRPGWIHSPDQLSESLQAQPGADRSGFSPAALKNQIYHLRQRLGKAGSQIQTVRGVGYTLRDEHDDQA